MLTGTAGRQVGSKQETACLPALEPSSLRLPYVWETNKHPAGKAKKKKKKCVASDANVQKDKGKLDSG